MNKIALITGAGKGIGLEMARQLARDEGFTVLVGSREEAGGQEAANELQSEGLDARFIWLDPTDAASIQNAKREVEAKFDALDVLINFAGPALPGDYAAPIDVPLDVLRETFDLNVFGTHAVTQAFWPMLNRAPAARLVNISSVLGSLSLQASGSAPIHPLGYDAAKAALNMMTIHYALGWQDTPHRANAAHPGNVQTPDNPQGQISVEEGAKTGVALATIPNDGPNGTFSHLGETMPW